MPDLMDLSRYRLIRAELNEDWDKFVESSKQGTIFSRKAFLESFSVRHGLWYCYKNNQLKAAVAVIETDDGKSCKSYNHIIYNGIMFAPEPAEQHWSQCNSSQFAITTFIIQEFSNMYNYIYFTNSPHINDLRPFLWHNYHNEGPKVKYDLRYTSTLNLPQKEVITEDSTLFHNFNTLRRRAIRSGIKNGIKTKPEFNIDEFIKLYQKTFERQKLSVDRSEVELLCNIITNLAQNSMVRGITSYDSQGNTGTILIFGIDSKRAYYLYGGSNPAIRSENTNSIAFWDAFKHLAKEGITEVDFEGINSPNRGYFKLSFGGSITPYYRVYWEKG